MHLLDFSAVAVLCFEGIMIADIELMPAVPVCETEVITIQNSLGIWE